MFAAGALFLYVKMHQRGPAGNRTHTTQSDRINVPVVLPQGNRGVEDLDRMTTHIFYSQHARCRMECRHIDEREIKEILEKGTVNYSKIEEDARGKTYPLEGTTHENQHLRVVFAPKNDGVLVVTCIDLDREWSCDCK